MTVCYGGKNFDGSNVCELHALDLMVENEDPLSENLSSVGMMNCAAEVVGNWITPCICPLDQENCCNISRSGK